jgi:cephalosporin hydroxylase
MRVEPVEVDLDLTHVKSDALTNRIVKWMQGSDPDIAFTASEVAQELEEEYDDVLATLESNKQLFFKTDAYILLSADN